MNYVFRILAGQIIHLWLLVVGTRTLRVESHSQSDYIAAGGCVLLAIVTAAHILSGDPDDAERIPR